MSLKEEVVTMKRNKAILAQVGGVLRPTYRSLNHRELVSLLVIPATKYNLQQRLKRKQSRHKTRKFRKRRGGNKKSRRRK